MNENTGPNDQRDAAHGRECPSEATLSAYLAGNDDATVPSHIDECETCRVLLGELVRAERPDARPTAERVAAQTLSRGERLGGRYQIEAFVARGGMGEVYRATDLALGETIALKTLTCTSIDDGEATLRLKEEVLLARKVTHPNVCRILEFGLYERERSERLPFMTMEFLHGETLGRRLANAGALEADAIQNIMMQTLDGLAAIHAAGIIHRDLKSENLFLIERPEQPPRVVVMDFGLARATTRREARPFSSSGRPVGTADYMAPEQVLGQVATVASDIYAVGVTLFEMLTRQLPFPAETPMAAAARRLSETAPRPSDVAPGVDPRWDDVVARCLARAPEDRFASLEDVRRAILSIQPTKARPRPWRRRAVVLLAAGTIAVAGVAIAARATKPALAPSPAVGLPAARASAPPSLPPVPAPAPVAAPLPRTETSPTVRPAAPARVKTAPVRTKTSPTPPVSDRDRLLKPW